MSQTTLGTYTGDTFRNLVRKYSQDRMTRDQQYRRGTEKILETRRKTKKTEAK